MTTFGACVVAVEGGADRTNERPTAVGDGQLFASDRYQTVADKGRQTVNFLKEDVGVHAVFPAGLADVGRVAAHQLSDDVTAQTVLGTHRNAACGREAARSIAAMYSAGSAAFCEKPPGRQEIADAPIPTTQGDSSAT